MNAYQRATASYDDAARRVAVEAMLERRQIVIARQSAAPVGDCLSGGMHSQTYRWID